MSGPIAHEADVVVVGAGAAGLMAAIFAGRGGASVVALDGARTLGAKILVAGGGRCNVTHHAVDEQQYAGSSRPAIRNVLRRFDVPETVQFFRELGVELKREDTGKLFPVTDDAHTVLDALLAAARDAGVKIYHPVRVDAVERAKDGFVVREAAGGAGGGGRSVRAQRVIIATGGMALPKSGSDGQGYQLVRALGHTTTGRIFPALVPLTLPEGHFLRALSGITLPARLQVHGPTGKKLASFTNSLLLTHFGISGPAALDISRYYLDARASGEHGGARATLRMSVLPEIDAAELDRRLTALGKATPVRLFMELGLAERLARGLCAAAGVDPAITGHALTREARRALVDAATDLELPVTGDRGFTYAEVTAGGVPLSEVKLQTMESRACPGLFLCGEICDVDGRIGGFNFQWAWASGYVAGVSAARREEPAAGA